VSDQSVATTGTQLDQLCINTIRTLSIDAVQKANSASRRTDGLAPVAYCLWQQFCATTPKIPFGRTATVSCSPTDTRPCCSIPVASGGVRDVAADGKVLSTPAVSLDEIKNFRQLGSKTPGHPEYGVTTGVETTTGPLGQGVANSVGMAIAERWLAAHFNRPGFELFNYNIWAICGDGDMMEGISSEAASVAGHLRLSNLCWIYDNNHITIEGNTNLAYDENVPARFAAYGWDVQHVTMPTIGSAGPCLQPRARYPRSSEADRCRQPHRLRLAPPPGYQGSPRRTARRRRSEADQARLRLAGGCQVSRPRRRARKLPRRAGQAREAIERTVEHAVR